MAFHPEHELHKRRLGRNMGVGLVLLAFVVLVYSLTIAKVGDENPPVAQTSTQGNG